MRIAPKKCMLALLIGFTCTTLMWSQAAREDAPGVQDIRPSGKHHGDIHAPRRARVGGARSGNGIYYHGGPVMLGTPNVYFIWYGNWSNNTAPSILENFISNLGGSSYANINTTYYNGANQHVTGLLRFAGSAADAYSRGTALNDSDIQSIVAAHCTTLGSCDPHGIYFVLTSADVNETTGFCTQYCGWHTSGNINGADIKFAFVGNPDRCPSACEAQSISPNNNAGADGMANIIAHETQEAISDPDLNAWYDNRGFENEDKCAWTFGTVRTASNGSKYNITLGGSNYLIQRNWVNANGGYCAMSY
jgi:hypothetical protein